MANFNRIFVFLAAFLLVFLPGCEVVGNIFEAGVWVGVLAVVLFIALFVWLLKKLLS